jgi:diaminohydroxyphosphoribosylaminopyrimidine deaminase / 5-amino-6-(5-phosphoribosylamino)uracil reductase
MAPHPPEGWSTLPTPEAISTIPGVQYLMVEGGAGAASAFLKAGLVDRLLLYRAPRDGGGSGPALPQLTQAALAGSPEWRLIDTRPLGNDCLQVYDHA